MIRCAFPHEALQHSVLSTDCTPIKQWGSAWFPIYKVVKRQAPLFLDNWQQLHTIPVDYSGLSAGLLLVTRIFKGRVGWITGKWRVPGSVPMSYKRLKVFWGAGKVQVHPMKVDTHQLFMPAKRIVWFWYAWKLTDLQLSLGQFAAQREAAGMKISWTGRWRCLSDHSSSSPHPWPSPLGDNWKYNAAVMSGWNELGRDWAQL